MTEDLKKYSDEAVAIRRALHRRPEEGWTEFETTWRVVTELERMGYAVRCGREVIDPEHALGRSEALVREGEERALAQGVPQAFLERLAHYTGAVAELDTARPGPVTAFRFDIDCVLVTESADASHAPAACGFASERPGFMHACGHDAHAASGLALAHWAIEHRDELCGRLRFIFQPAEEGTRGAAAMAAAGVVDDVDWFFGAHVGVFCHSGEIGVIRRGFLATTKIDIAFEGTPSHAGARPEAGRSALSAAASCTLQLEGIPRHSGGDTRIAVGALRAGEGRNVTPTHALMQIEVRGETAEVNDWMVSRVDSIVKGTAESYEVKGSWVNRGEATTIVSDAEAVEAIERAARVNGLKVAMFDRAGGSEDCSMLVRRAQQKGAKAGFFLWGCEQNGHHRPDFDIQDSENLPRAVAVFTTIARETNGRS